MLVIEGAVLQVSQAHGGERAQDEQTAYQDCYDNSWIFVIDKIPREVRRFRGPLIHLQNVEDLAAPQETTYEAQLGRRYHRKV